MIMPTKIGIFPLTRPTLFLSYVLPEKRRFSYLPTIAVLNNLVKRFAKYQNCKIMLKMMLFNFLDVQNIGIHMFSDNVVEI